MATEVLSTRVRKANSILRSAGRSFASCWRELVLPPCCQTHTSAISSARSQCKKDMGRLERVQQRATKTIMGLEQLSGAGRVQPGEDKVRGDLIQVYKHLVGRE